VRLKKIIRQFLEKEQYTPYDTPQMAEKQETQIDLHWRELAGNAQKGDATAYRTLLSDLIPIIRRTVIKSLPNPQNADDVVQEVLLSIHKALHTYDPKRPFMPWVHSIIQFRKIDYLRQHYAHHDNVKISLDDPDTPDYLVISGHNGTTKDVETAFATLPDQQKKVVELMKIKGYSAEEVSKKTGLSISAVKVTAHRALQKIKERL
jgi:RNA polymerase sigma-70 factor, ECF subfamily